MLNMKNTEQGGTGIENESNGQMERCISIGYANPRLRVGFA